MTVQAAPNGSKKPQQFMVMLVGKTHAGKTTFGKRLNRWLPSNTLIEPDDISVFLSRHLPQLYYRRYLAEYGHRYPKLKFQLYFNIFRFALSCRRNVTLTNNNIRRQRRVRIIKMARRHSAKTIMVFLDLPDRVLIQRIRRIRRPQKHFFEEKNFEDILLSKQNHQLNRPSSNEASYFLVAHKARELPRIERRLRYIIKGLGYAV